MNTDEKMLIIHALDDHASVMFSPYTHKWYVSAQIEIGDGVIVRGITEHRDTPEEAADAFFVNMTEMSLDEYLVTEYHGHRREWVWNGAAFVEKTRDVALPQPLERR